MTSVLHARNTSQTWCFLKSIPGAEAWGKSAFLCLEPDTTLDAFYGEPAYLLYKRPIYGLPPFTSPKLFYKRINKRTINLNLGKQFKKSRGRPKIDLLV